MKYARAQAQRIAKAPVSSLGSLLGAIVPGLSLFEGQRASCRSSRTEPAARRGRDCTLVVHVVLARMASLTSAHCRTPRSLHAEAVNTHRVHHNREIASVGDYTFCSNQGSSSSSTHVWKGGGSGKWKQRTGEEVCRVIRDALLHVVYFSKF